MRFIRILLLFIFPLSACNAEEVSMENKEKFLSTLEIGETIISALNRYKNDVGEHPTYLAQLVPKYLERIPETELGNRFSYLNFSNISGYFGQDGFDLMFNPEKESLFGSNANSYFVYSSDKNYSGSNKIEVHFIYNDWAYVTAHRNAIGEGGRIE